MEVQRGTSGQVVWGTVAGRFIGKLGCRSDTSISTKNSFVTISERTSTTEPDRVAPALSNCSSKLWDGFSQFSASDWAQRRTAVSEEDFEREPHRNRFTALLGRTAHLAYHVGQATLARPKA